MAQDEGPSLTWMGIRTGSYGESAKWLVAGLGSIGAALIGGLQLAKLGDVHGIEHVVVVVAAGSVAVLALVAAVMITVSVMLPGTVSLGELRQREENAGDSGSDDLITYIHANRAELLREPDDKVADLEDDYALALQARRDAYEALYAGAQHQDVDKLLERVNETEVDGLRLAAFVQRVLAAAKLHQARSAFARARAAVGVLALCIAVCVVLLTWATNAPDKPTVDLRGADLNSSSLTGVDLRGANLDGMTIKGADLTGTYLGDASVEGTKWLQTTCPDGVFSDNAGNTCAGHLEP